MIRPIQSQRPKWLQYGVIGITLLYVGLLGSRLTNRSLIPQELLVDISVVLTMLATLYASDHTRGENPTKRLVAILTTFLLIGWLLITLDILSL